MKENSAYIDSIYRSGAFWNLGMMVVLLLFPICVGLIFHAGLDWHGFLLGLLATAPMYWAVAVIEVFTYIPMLGAGGSYLSFVTGNISNLKLPVALNALEQAEQKAVPVKPGVENEADADREKEQKHHHADVPEGARSVDAVKIFGILFHAAPPQDSHAVIGIAPAMPAIRLIGSA